MARYIFGDVRPDGPVTLVALLDAAICGFATTGPSRDEDAADAGEMYALYVDPQYWGRGIGRSLIAEARTQLSRQGLGKAVLWVLAGNERAQRFYRADGWQSDGHRRQEYVWGAQADEVRFRRGLP
jgi:ribosomal protein S18 acetylase RimI-like enzyme